MSDAPLCRTVQHGSEGPGSEMAGPVAAERRAGMRRLLRDSRSRRGHPTVMGVLDTGSMRPLMRGDCDVRIEWGIPQSGADILGQILVFDVEDGLVLVHRAAAERLDSGCNRWILHVADNYPMGDPYAAYWVEEQKVLGTVTAVRAERDTEWLDLTTPLARRLGKLVARCGAVAWRRDRSSRRRIEAPVAFALRRIVTCSADTIIRAVGRRVRDGA